MHGGLHDHETGGLPSAGISRGDGGHGGEDSDGAERERREARNILWLEIHQVIVRVGWIFKTETIIMPAVLDAVVDSGTLRGLLPVLNRGGQSVPPLLFSGAVARAPVKKWALSITVGMMATAFALLAVAWSPLAEHRPDLLATLFLVLYALFSCSNGLNQLVLAALQGKLIAPGHRGRAMLVSVSLGSVLAIIAALLWLGRWLAEADGFPKIFAATGGFFALAAVFPLLLDEPADGGPARVPARSSGDGRGWIAAGLTEWRRTLSRDGALVRLALVAACFSLVIMLFPHYQAFARDRLGSRIGSLLTWVVVQNAATGIVSLVVGPFSDRRGTRSVLAALVALSAMTPLIVAGLGRLPHEIAVERFWIVYLPLGLNPLALRMFTNYALELAPTPADHARYVSIVGGALAAPFVLSPAIGHAVDRLGFEPVFLAGAAVIAAGGAVAAGLPEPRRRGRAV